MKAYGLPNNIRGPQPCLRIGCIGDSISIGGVIATGTFSQNHYLPQTCFLLDGVIEWNSDWVWALTGYDFGEMITAGYHTTAAASVADIIVIHGGANLPTGGFDGDVALANVATMTETLLSAGKIVVLTSIGPTDEGYADAAWQLHRARFNSLVKAYAASMSNVYFCDFSAAWTDQTTDPTALPTFTAALTDGPPHPQEDGYLAAAVKLAAVLSRLPNIGASRRPDFSDLRYLSNVLMLGTDGATTSGEDCGDLATGFAFVAGAAGTVATKEARTDGLNGIWQQYNVDTGDDDFLVRLAGLTLPVGTYNAFMEVEVHADAVANSATSARSYLIRIADSSGDVALARPEAAHMCAVTMAGKSGIWQLPFEITNASNEFTITHYPGRFDGITKFGALWIEPRE